MTSHSPVRLDLSDTSKALAVLGFSVAVLGLFTKPIKQNLYVPDSALSTILGIIVGPVAADWVSPLHWNSQNVESSNDLTYELMRIAIGLQVFFCGIDLPKSYFLKSWKSLCYMVGPVMIFTWLVTSLLIWSIIPHVQVLEAMTIAACVAPTDPVLSNAIAKGHYAETQIPERIRHLLAAESGMNDGLGVPFIYLALYLLRAQAGNTPTRRAVSDWVCDIIVYEITFGVLIGILIGFLARKGLRLARTMNLIENESILLYALGLPFLILGVTGMVGLDDILVSFVAANSFNWDGYYATETHALTGHVAFQDLIDTFLNSALFIYIATIIPWHDFTNSSLELSLPRLIGLAILILILKRLPAVAASFVLIPDLRSLKDVLFVGWFGPIGVGAVYYSQVGLREIPAEQEKFRKLIFTVVMFLVLISIFVYAISVPIIYFGGIFRDRYFTKRAGLTSRPSSPSVPA